MPLPLLMEVNGGVCVIARNHVKECKMRPCFWQPLRNSIEIRCQSVAKNGKNKNPNRSILSS